MPTWSPPSPSPTRTRRSASSTPPRPATCRWPFRFTLEHGGRLPSGDPLDEAIARTDAETGAYPAYYMINCAHPSHVEPALQTEGAWRRRLRGLRANASRRSHAELDESTEQGDGDPQQLGEDYLALHGLLPRLNIVGGCCGTDERHVEAIARRLLAVQRERREDV
ncbi:homocysteine S-methyltransferase family protein [Massilia sp. Dwa41.01b]|uniref:homocysteine S-methyltransferase family protein n=1 Tax=Massilia sp. Dwa41.01b TaxID=2709302 RepID=UPI001E49AFF5|nr:homocysteine S-methyltransferase family protein [Massilia sp. Dwa41.01b]